MNILSDIVIFYIAPDVKPEVDPSGKPTNEKALLGKPNSGKGKSKGLDLVIILVVVVAVSIGVVFILVIAVAVLYKKNKECKNYFPFCYHLVFYVYHFSTIRLTFMLFLFIFFPPFFFF